MNYFTIKYLIFNTKFYVILVVTLQSIGRVAP